MLTVTLILLLCALVITIGDAMGKAPLWPAVLILIVVGLLQSVPVR